MTLNPIKLTGNWDEGFALDNHSVSSEHVGDDVYGHPQFKTVRTELGELLYKMKYNGHHDTSDQISDIAGDFLEKWLKDKPVDMILPVPPTKNRDIQPLFVIVEAISSRCNIPYSTDVLAKSTEKQSKDMARAEKDLTGAIKLMKNAKRKCSILLIDDLFESGATATECVNVLKTDPLVDKVYLLAITKTR